MPPPSASAVAFRDDQPSRRRLPTPSRAYRRRSSGVRVSSRSGMPLGRERRPAARQQPLRERALDARLELEELLEIRPFPDDVANARRQLLPGGLGRLPEVDGAPAVALGVGDPQLEPQALDRPERVDGLVAQVLAQAV